MIDVLVVHLPADSEIADRFCERLQARGVNVVQLDRELPPEQIERHGTERCAVALIEALVTVVVVSPAALRVPWLTTTVWPASQTRRIYVLQPDDMAPDEIVAVFGDVVLPTYSHLEILADQLISDLPLLRNPRPPNNTPIAGSSHIERERIERALLTGSAKPLTNPPAPASVPQAAEDQAERDALYAKRMAEDDVPPTLGSAPVSEASESETLSQSQAERDAIYAERMAKDDVPPTRGSAPVPERGSAPAAPELPKPGPALTEKILPAPSVGDGLASVRDQTHSRDGDPIGSASGGGAAPASRPRVEGVGAASDGFTDRARLLRQDHIGGVRFGARDGPAAAKAPAFRENPPTGNVALSRAAIQAFALQRQSVISAASAAISAPRSEAAGAARPPATAYAMERARVATPSPRQVSQPAKRSSGGWLFAVALAALASLPLLSRTVRDSMGDLLAGLGLKLNVFNFFGLLRTRGADPAKPINAPAQVDDVDCSVYAPPSAPRGATVLVQVFLHVPEQAARVHDLATMMDTTAALKGVQTLSASIARGTKVDVYVSAPELGIEEPAQTFIWRGEPVFCQFLVTLPAQGTNARFYPVVRLSVGGGLVGRIAFGIEVIEGPQAAEAALNTTQSVPSGLNAHRYRRAFLSYASQDRREVLKRAQALEAAGVTFFHDVLSLEPGARWEKELYKHIDSCDLFLLFWSKHAASSRWVIQEAEYAKARQNAEGLPDIIPIMLDGPPPQTPPSSLNEIHFNDRISYFIAAS